MHRPRRRGQENLRNFQTSGGAMQGLWIALLLVLPTLELVGQVAPARQAGARAPSKWSLEGDVYLLMKSGDTKQGSARTVYLARATEDLVGNARAICRSVDSTRTHLTLENARLLSVGRRHIDRAANVPGTSAGRAQLDTAQMYSDSARANLVRMNQLPELLTKKLGDLIVAFGKPDTARSGMNAHYRFASLSPGNYLLFTEWRISDTQYHWLTPVTVSGNATKDLDNDAQAQHLCGADIVK